MKKLLIIICLLCLVGCAQNDTKLEPEQSLTVLQDNEGEEVKVSDNQETKNEDEVKEQQSPIINVKDEKNVSISKEGDNGVTVLKFKNTNSNETINALSGKQVSITGYISTLSPLNGEFAYLMNMPYQSCPFCVPGTSEISNTLAIYAGNKSKIKFTDQPVTVVGTLETGNFVDDFGYEYGVRLNNVTVNKADVDKLSASIKQYNLLAENGVVSQIYNSIMSADASVFYNYYELEKPEKIEMDFINSTKATLEGYNEKGEYNQLISTMDNLIDLCSRVNTDVELGDYSKFISYQRELQNVYYTFSVWMSEGEL